MVALATSCEDRRAIPPSDLVNLDMIITTVMLMPVGAIMNAEIMILARDVR